MWIKYANRKNVTCCTLIIRLRCCCLCCCTFKPFTWECLCKVSLFQPLTMNCSMRGAARQSTHYAYATWSPGWALAATNVSGCSRKWYFLFEFCSFLLVIAVKVMRWSAIRRCCQLPFVSREWKVLAVKWPGSNLIVSHVYTAKWLSSECVWVLDEWGLFWFTVALPIGFVTRVVVHTLPNLIP